MKIFKQFLVIISMICFSTVALKAQVKTVKNKAVLLAEDQAFLKKNKTQPGVIETASGLQYKIVKMGSGPKPRKFNRVLINYTLKSFDGKILASNGNKPWDHRQDKALYGMQESLKMMPVGSKWILYMPASLARSKYQDINGKGLICNIELLALD